MFALYTVNIYKEHNICELLCLHCMNVRYVYVLQIFFCIFVVTFEQPEQNGYFWSAVGSRSLRQSINRSINIRLLRHGKMRANKIKNEHDKKSRNGQRNIWAAGQKVSVGLSVKTYRVAQNGTITFVCLNFIKY